MKILSGNRGEAVRSDCYVELLENGNSLNIISLKSKVKSLYGNSIEELAHKMLVFYNIKGVEVLIEDFGALPFVLAARLESVLNKFSASGKPFLLEIINENRYLVSRDNIGVPDFTFPATIQK